MSDYHPQRFADKYLHALEVAQQSYPKSGIAGLELEWNLLDGNFRPLLRVGSGPGQRSFIDYLRNEVLSPEFKSLSQLEVYHWMIEWATRPYYHLLGTIYESRLVEAVMLNALQQAGSQFGERLHYWHGNLLYKVGVNHDSIPEGWNLAKRRYLQRCVDLFGEQLATAGIHVNLSLPEPLLAWDFMHLPVADRTGGAYPPLQLDDYKNQVYIRLTRLLRAFAALFMATSASTPMQAMEQEGRTSVVLTEADSVRNLVFPNPPTLDVPLLYRSYEDYLNLSYDLVRRKVRFGNNNWTPVRARSFAEPVERLIYVTSEQLGDLYARGLYAVGEAHAREDMAAQIEIQNLLARINLPMARVEIRTDEGGHSLELDVANLALKHLLMLRMYADSDFASSFRYDHEDIERSRRNEASAARFGLRGEIENPLTGKPVGMREFLSWTLDEIAPLANALQLEGALQPLVEMAGGGMNTAEKIRHRVRQEIGEQQDVPLELLRQLAEEQEAELKREIVHISGSLASLGIEAPKLEELLQLARDEARKAPGMPVDFAPSILEFASANNGDTTGEIVEVAARLVRFKSVTACPDERLDEVRRAALYILDYARFHGLQVRYFNEQKYPALLLDFPGVEQRRVLLSGHFDVVAPDPDDSQFEPRIDGDYLWGRGAADMKTVVATCLVWMKDRARAGGAIPPISLLLVGNEENGESEPYGTPHVLAKLDEEGGSLPELIIAGERTGEKGVEIFGEICTENRGIMRFTISATAQKGHTGAAQATGGSLSERLLAARQEILETLRGNLRLSSPDGWQSQVQVPFLQVGEAGVFNISPGQASFGVEVRPIPKENLAYIHQWLTDYCQQQGFELRINVMEAGISCPLDNPALLTLMDAYRFVSGENAPIGRKLPATSARFAPGGRAVVWGQSGIAPHGRDERHFIPSILPYYRVLNELANRLSASDRKL